MSVRGALERTFVPVERMLTGTLRPACAARARLAPRLAVLMYHQVGRPVAGVPATYECVSPARLHAHVSALRGAGYRFLTLADGARLLRRGERTALRRAVVLTFDDGLAGQFDAALPVLRAHAAAATFFVVAGQIGRAGPLPHLGLTDPHASAWWPFGWNEARELQRHGMEIGSHALSHRSLGGLGRGAAVAEIRGSRELLEAALGARVESFAYPFGSAAYGDVNDGLRDLVGASGYLAGCTTVVGRNGVGADLLALRRLPVEDADDGARVLAKVVGAYDWVGTLKNAWQRRVRREEDVA